jgi:competence protein ComEC
MSKLFVKVWDVQHGLAIYVQTPNGKHIVIDLGTGDISGNNSVPNKIFSPLKHLKQAYRVNQLDQVIITHPHTDHIDDIANFNLLSPRVLRAAWHIPEEDIRKQNRSSDAVKINTYLDLLKRYTAPISKTDSPILPENNGGVEIDFFSPVNCPTYNLNNQSIVIFLTFANSTICIPGDNERASWKELLEQPGFKDMLRKTDVFLASHHGRESGFFEEVFDYCKPSVIVISDGPQGETCVADKYRLRASGWKVYSRSRREYKDRKVLTTRKDGAIQIECYPETANII